MSDPVEIGEPVPRGAVHLLPASELFERGYPSTAVALCGELMTTTPDRGDDPSYCCECVRVAIAGCAPIPGERHGH
ncbi:MAG: hypothetical protein ACRDRA_22235 [Pseudonocardiaceae bacterium]